MARPCNVCTHPKRHDIDAKILANDGSAAAIARLFDLKKDSILRHRAHIQNEIKATQTIKATGFHELLKAVERLTSRLEKHLGNTRRSETWFKESRELRNWISLRSKLAGKVTSEEGKRVRAGDAYNVVFRGPDGESLRIPLAVFEALSAEVFAANGNGGTSDTQPEVPRISAEEQAVAG